MAHDLNHLIEKIRQEGIQSGQESARRIEEEARARAESVVADARKEAEAMVQAARREAAMLRESGVQAVRQAARDTLLTLRESLLASLRNLAAAEVRQALGSREIAAIVHDFILKAGGGSESVLVDLRPDQVEQVRDALVPRLSERLRAGLTLRSSGAVAGGFTISFDAGTSHFDFSDAALADYFCSMLRPAVAAVVRAPSD